MTRAILVALSLALAATASVARAQEPPFVGRFELSGRHQPTLRRTTVALEVRADAAGALTVTRTARAGAKTIVWTSATARASGQRLTVRYETGGGLSGNVRQVQYVQRSDQVAAGATVLTRPEIDRLVTALERIQERFKRLYDAQQDPAFAMDVEWKFDAQGRLVVKQARPVVD